MESFEQSGEQSGMMRLRGGGSDNRRKVVFTVAATAIGTVLCLIFLVIGAVSIGGGADAVLPSHMAVEWTVTGAVGVVAFPALGAIGLFFLCCGHTSL